MLGGGAGREQKVHAALADAGTDDGPGVEVGELHDLVSDFLTEQPDRTDGVEVNAFHALSFAANTYRNQGHKRVVDSGVHTR